MTLESDTAQVVDSARRTLAGQSVAGGIVAAGYSQEFVLEPSTGRCALSVPSNSVVDDTAEYVGPDSDGRWVHRVLSHPGARIRTDPRLVLDLLVAESFLLGDPLSPDHRDGYGFHLGFDNATVGSLLDGGLAPDWVVTGSVTCAAWSPVRTLGVTLSRGTEVRQTDWTMRWYGPQVSVLVADPSKLIEYPDWVEEQQEESYR